MASEPFLGEIIMFAGNYELDNWAFCNGQLLEISEYEPLFNLIGTTYGGDGQSTFALPDLRGRVPVHMGNDPGSAGFNYLGENGGVEQVILTINQMPSHQHQMTTSALPAYGASPGSTYNPENAYPAISPGNKLYSTTPIDGEFMAVSTPPTNLITSTGGNQPHDNMQPYLCVNFIICTWGIFPSQS